MDNLKITVDFNKEQIIKIFRQLNTAERKSIFAEFKDDIYDFLTDKDVINKMTTIEYNNKINEAEVAYKKGKYLTSDELDKEVETWM
ncbi:MAG: hypothetical protein JXL97_17060 [Bacteroidales bacterium]|nr:hypothetical protein [Bacteroidales bacterium]